FYQFEAVEETGDLFGAAKVVGADVGVLVEGPLGLDDHRIGVSAVIDHQVAAGGQCAEQPAHDRLRVVGSGDLAEDAQHHQRDGLGEVERPGRLPQDRAGVAHVGVDVGGGAFGVAGEQGPRVDQHEGVVVHVNDAGLRDHALGDLVGV